MKRIVIHEEYCIGCRLCEVNCLVAHSKSKKILKVFKEEFRFRDADSHIVIEQSGALSFAMPCRHCEDARCIEACMVGALYRDEKTKAVLLDSEKCIGCFMCLMSCPFGAIKRSTKGDKKIASKCDLCISAGEDIPVCVKNCPNEALAFEEIKEEK